MSERSENSHLRIYADAVRYFGELLPETASMAHLKAIDRLVDAYEKAIEIAAYNAAFAMSCARDDNRTVDDAKAAR